MSKLKFFLLMLCCMASANAISQPAPLKPDLLKSIQALPPDIESLAVVNESFHWATPTTDDNRDQSLSFEQMLRWIISTGGKQLAPLPDAVKRLNGQKFEWAVYAKRKQQTNVRPGSNIVELGAHPYEFVSILQASTPISDEFFSTLRQQWLTQESDARHKIWKAQSSNFYLIQLSANRLAFLQTLDNDRAMLDDFFKTLAMSPPSILEMAEPVLKTLSEKQTIWSVRKATHSILLEKLDSKGSWTATSFLDNYTTMRIVALAQLKLSADQLAAVNGVTQVQKDMGMTVKSEVSNDSIQASIQCLPGYVQRCMFLPIYFETLGLMIWI
jgi:hypothetical protein